MAFITFGNAKLPSTTMIFNMGSAKDCPSRKLGLCKVAGICYARKAEIMYPNVLPSRDSQAIDWSNTAQVIYKRMKVILNRKRNKINLFRFNESGDFYSQQCITKLNYIAERLLAEFGITTYGYTARKDLDFSNASFLVKGSGHDSGNNGKTIVIRTIDDLPCDYSACIGDCKVCSMCSQHDSKNIAFVKH